jgi:uncharacterized protein with HEPN domain
MSNHPPRLPDYLGHISEAIERIQRYTGDLSESAFLQSDIAQDAVIRNLEIIGEASRNIERNHADFAAAHPELPLGVAYEMRNALAHGYFKVDLSIVWKTIQPKNSSYPDAANAPGGQNGPREGAIWLLT